MTNKYIEVNVIITKRILLDDDTNIEELTKKIEREPFTVRDLCHTNVVKYLPETERFAGDVQVYDWTTELDGLTYTSNLIK